MAPELFRFKKGSLSYIPFSVKRFELADNPKFEKLPYPDPVFITDPGAVCAMKLRSFPGLGTSEISRSLKLVEISEVSVCSSAASPETSTVVPAEPTSSFALIIEV